MKKFIVNIKTMSVEITNIQQFLDLLEKVDMTQKVRESAMKKALEHASDKELEDLEELCRKYLLMGLLAAEKLARAEKKLTK